MLYLHWSAHALAAFRSEVDSALPGYRVAGAASAALARRGRGHFASLQLSGHAVVVKSSRLGV